jgi:pyruvate,water dikinase
MTQIQSYIIPFEQCSRDRILEVGGKNASIGEMLNGIKHAEFRMPEGFVLSTQAFENFIKTNRLNELIARELLGLNAFDEVGLQSVSEKICGLILEAHLPEVVNRTVEASYDALCKTEPNCRIAVRSSASAEDLPKASFAGIHDSFLNVCGYKELNKAILQCYASLYSPRAIRYREVMKYPHEKVLLSIGIQRMIRSDIGVSGVSFSIDPDSGFRDVVIVNGSWGLGETIVQGLVEPDEFHVFKRKINKVAQPIISKRLGSKSVMQVFDKENGGTISVETDKDQKTRFCLNDNEIVTIASLTSEIESFYGFPVDVEWAKDGISGSVYIVQARPETVKSQQDIYQIKAYSLTAPGKVLCTGTAAGQGIVSGRIRILHDSSEMHLLQKGEILLTESTNPDWDPILKKAAAIITCKGGRTSHAAIVAREMGTLALVGAADALKQIHDGTDVTVDCSQGQTGIAYEGLLSWTETVHNFEGTRMPTVKPQFILANPEQAYALSFYPSAGVGLMRLEFAIAGSIGVHPLALIYKNSVKQIEDRKLLDELTRNYAKPVDYFTQKLSEAVATIAAAFYPREVIVRMSDFKSNEYAKLIGGEAFEPIEENPMLGLRGASRYYSGLYKEAFLLECKAMKRVREEMGFHNVKLMIPFCRTPEEGRKVLTIMEQAGLKRGENGLEIYVMAEIPSNILQAGEFARIFDGFSIGSNDLTQLCLGIDRDSADVAHLFDENNDSVRQLIAQLIAKAKTAGVKIGLCGQAASDSGLFVEFLVEHQIDTISFTPDALISGIEAIKAAESKLSLAL